MKGSLAQRVLVGSIVLLGLPLFVHTFFLYHREYRENIEDAFLILKTLADGRKTNIEQMIECQLNMLSGLLDNLPEDPGERSAFLEKEAKDYQIDQFLVLKRSKDERMRKKSFVFIDREKKALVVGMELTPESVFIITTPTDQLLRRLQYKSVYEIGLSFINEEGLIFLTTEKGLEDERYASSNAHLKWIAEEGVEDGWFLESQKERFLAVSVPIKNTEYSFMADVPERSIAAIQIQDYVVRIALFLIFSCLISGGILVWVTRRISKPLNSLRLVMQRVSEGAVHIRYSPDKMGFEINTIGVQLNQMLDALLNSQQEVEKERIARERLAQELKIGHQIQTSMLPTDFLHVPSLEVFPGYHSALEVSGDFYDLVVLEGGRVLIAIADAAGKGISACLFSLSFRSMLRSVAATQQDLAAIVRIANDLLMYDTSLSSFFITAWLGLYDPKSGELSYCSQGHPPTLLVREKEVQLLSTGGIAFGVEPIDPTIKTIQLLRQDLLFLYTDGITEAENGRKELFGMERLKEVILRSRASLKADARLLLEEIEQFCAGASQSDDVTFLFLRVK